MYVTNYQVLHALRISRVVFGSELPPGEMAYAPAYYARSSIVAAGLRLTWRSFSIHGSTPAALTIG